MSMEAVIEAYRKRVDALAESENPYADGIAWVEGELVPLAKARIPLLDQGFMHSDLTYDVPAIWDGRFFRLDDHLDRLERSCAKLRLTSPMDRETLRRTLVEMAAKSGIRDAYVQITVTRGFKFVRAHRPEDIENHIYLLIMPYVWVMSPDVQARGGSAVMTRTVRRIPPGAIDPTVKNLQWGDFVRGIFEARDRGAMYPFLPDGDGNLTEGSGFNIFLVKDGVLHTPARGVLEGVTRRTVVEIAEAQGWTVNIDHVPVDLAYQCDEIFMSTTAGGIMPITELDGGPVGGGQVGPVTRQIWQAYWDLHYDDRLSFAIDYTAA